MIELDAVGKQVRTQEGVLTILKEISFVANESETIAIVGASGSGKSTLLGLMAGLDLPSSGDIKINNRSLVSLDEDGRAAIRAEWVGFVFQSFQLLPSLTALENVQLPLELGIGNDPSVDPLELLERVGLADRAHHLPKQLSGGEQQRVAIARAFVTGPKILFADEPTGNLDQVTGEKIINLLFDLNQEQGTTLVLVTHDNHLASRCKRTIRLDAGAIIEDIA